MSETFKLVKLLDPIQIVNITDGFVPRGEYNALTNYAVGDSVSYNGSSYIMYLDAPAGTLPTNTTYWQVVAEGSGGGGGGAVDSIVAGTGITVNSTDPANPIVATTITQYTDELAQDAVGTALTDTSTVDFTYNDGANTISASVLDSPTLQGQNGAYYLNRTNHTGSQAITTITNLQTALDNKVDENAAITGATKTKITYDAKGLVTAGADATTTDINEGSNLYFSDERAQDAVGAMVDTTLTYTDATPSLSRAALTGDITASAGSNTTAIAAGVIVNADVNTSAGISLTKLAATTASRALVSDASGFITPATTTSTEIGYVNGVTSGIQNQLNNKVSSNTAITGATNTKITYDSKGLVTAGTAATTADINDSTNRRYVTDAQQTVISNTSGTNTGDQSVFTTVAVSGQSNVVADSTSDTLTLIAGTNVTLTTNATNDSVTISSTGSTGGGGQVNSVVAGTGISVNSADPVNPIVSSTITQYTDEMSQDAVGTILTDSTEIDFTYNDGTPSITASLIAGSIDEAKLDSSVNTSLGLANTALQSSAIGSTVQAYNANTTVQGNATTGSGSIVLATSPTIVTPTIASFTNANHNHTNAAGGGTLTSAAISDFTEASQDAVGNSLTDTESVDFTYNDATNTIIARSPANAVSISQTAHGFTVGNPIRYNGTAYVKAQANTGANAEVAGMVLSVPDANTFITASNGFVTGLSGLTPGGTYFLDPTTAGAITTTEPTTNGQVSKPVLVAVSTTSGYFSNSYRGLTIQQGIVASKRVVTLTDGATITPNADTTDIARVTIAGARTMAQPTGTPVDGQLLQFQIKQDATGGRTITWNAIFRFGNATPPTLTAGAGKTDFIGFQYHATDVKWDCIAAELNH